MSDTAPLSRRALLSAASGALAAPLLAGGAAAQGAPPVPTRAAARPAPKLEEPLPEAPGKRLGWAVVGLGKFALGQIMPAFGDCRLSRPVALVSDDPAKAADVGARFGVTKFYDYRNFDSIAADPAIDVVYIILPNSLHTEFTIRALKAGKHVFCEKPMATNSRDAQRMIAAARAAGKQLGIAYRAHWEPHNVKALQMVRAGELGDVRLFTSVHGRQLDTTDPADQWRARQALAGGGSLPDIGIYALNAARMFAGAEPVEISAAISNPPGDPRFAEVEDMVSFRLRFPSGMLADCVSAYSIKEEKRYQIFGSKASLLLDPATDYKRNALMLKAEQDEREIDADPASKQFSGEIDGFSEAVRSGQPFRTPGEEGLRDMRLIEAIYRAARSGRPVRV